MIEYAATLEDRAKRNSAVYTVVNMILQMNSHMKDQTEFVHKVWDHVHMMADYKLDVDSPFEPPSPELVNKKPEKLPYPHTKKQFRYYGKNVEYMIARALEMKDGEQKDFFINAIASYMKMSYRIFNDEKVSDEVILKHLEEMSGGLIKLDKIVELNSKYDTHLTNTSAPKGGYKKRHHGGRGKKRRHKR